MVGEASSTVDRPVGPVQLVWWDDEIPDVLPPPTTLHAGTGSSDWTMYATEAFTAIKLGRVGPDHLTRARHGDPDRRAYVNGVTIGWRIEPALGWPELHRREGQLPALRFRKVADPVQALESAPGVRYGTRKVSPYRIGQSHVTRLNKRDEIVGGSASTFIFPDAWLPDLYGDAAMQEILLRSGLIRQPTAPMPVPIDELVCALTRAPCLTDIGSPVPGPARVVDCTFSAIVNERASD